MMRTQTAWLSILITSLMLSCSTISEAQERPVVRICSKDLQDKSCKRSKVGNLWRVGLPKQDDETIDITLIPTVGISDSHNFEKLELSTTLGTINNGTLQLASFDEKGEIKKESTVKLTLSNAEGNFDKLVKVVGTAFYKDKTTNVESKLESVPIGFMIDSTPPDPLAPVVERFPGGSAKVYVKLKDIDLDVDKLKSATFAFKHVVSDAVDLSKLTLSGKNVESSSSTVTVLPSKDPEYDADRQTIVFEFSNLDPGVYGLVIGNLVDLVGNVYNSPANTALRFDVPAGEQRGEQVEFPRFLTPGNKDNPFNPGDTVDTRVVNLYYFRNARMIAEIINRNIQDLNQTAYDDAQRFAQNARKTADDAVDDRRFLETKAVQEAQKTRELVHQIDAARKKLNDELQQKAQIEAQQGQAAATLDPRRKTDGSESTATVDEMIKTRDADIAKYQKELDSLKDKMDSASNKRKQELNDAITEANKDRAILRSIQITQTRNTRQLTDLTSSITQDQANLSALSGRLEDQQASEIEAANQVQKAEAKELRTAQEKFRRELAAGLADRKSFAAGKISSIDPVTQVSITVVGPARIQLRGPMKGINKIRRMIHQLDTPVGQVKVGIHTVQVNGENGDRMDFVYERINREICHSRFLVNQSNQMFRKAVAEVATAVRNAVDLQGYVPPYCPPDFINGNDQASRDWRYVYTFFGKDFIDELREMDSELLSTQNKMLSLHSIDTISLSGALFVTALARNDIRLAIIERFRFLVQNELPQRESEYIRALTRVHTRHGKIRDLSAEKQFQKDAEEDAKIWFNAARTYHFPNTHTFFNQQLGTDDALNSVQYSMIRLAQVLKAQLVAEMEFKNLTLERSLLETQPGEIEDDYSEKLKTAISAKKTLQQEIAVIATELVGNIFPQRLLDEVEENMGERFSENDARVVNTLSDKDVARRIGERVFEATKDQFNQSKYRFWVSLSRATWEALGISVEQVNSNEFFLTVQSIAAGELNEANSTVSTNTTQLMSLYMRLAKTQSEVDDAEYAMEEAKKQLFSKRLLEQFLDEQEEKSVELLEALRSHSSNVDNYLKRLAIALEDDVNAQFYEPAFQRVRRVSRTWDVNLGQIETTTILTNNRTLAKVDPSATMEFDLPRRDIPLTEAMKLTDSLIKEYGNLLQDGTFLAGTSLIAGQVPIGIEGGGSAIKGIPGYQKSGHNEFGSELQKLIPDPAVYKFETGTGFEIRPVIQPDGQSIVYTFDYMYTTNVREPVRADEKHLGRIKRHFIHTDVQTSTYELREISRYTVALKASRTGRGVPLAEDLPLVGGIFRPLSSDESSLQTNIILGSSVIYPTMYDLMGLRWSPYVDDLNSNQLADEKQTQRDRRAELREHLLQQTRGTVNKTIGIPKSRPAGNIRIPTGF